MKSYNLNDFEEINPYYAKYRSNLQLIEIWDISEIVNLQEKYAGLEPESNRKAFFATLSDAQKSYLTNSFGHIASEGVLKNKEHVKFIPVFKGYSEEFEFDQETFPKQDHPWIVYFMGCDDSSYGMRFKTEKEANDFLSLGVDVGELDLAWKN